MFVFVTKSGSTTDIIFQQYIEKCIVELFPNLSPILELYLCEEYVTTELVLIKTDMGLGRLVTEGTDIEWRKRIKEKDCTMLGSAPNTTSVSVELDNTFGHYKRMCLKSTQRCYNKKLHVQVLTIRER